MIKDNIINSSVSAVWVTPYGGIEENEERINNSNKLELENDRNI